MQAQKIHLLNFLPLMYQRLEQPIIVMQKEALTSIKDFTTFEIPSPQLTRLKGGDGEDGTSSSIVIEEEIIN